MKSHFRECLCSPFVLFGILLTAVFWCSPVDAQEAFRVGDAVEFDFAGQTLTGTVVKSKRNGRLLDIKVFYSTFRGTRGKQTRAVLVDFKTQRQRTIARWDGCSMRFHASDPVHGRVIGLTDQGEVVLVGGISTASPTTDLCWELPRSGPGAKPKVRRAFLTPSAIAIIQCGPTAWAWDLNTRRELWRLGKLGGAMAAISPGGRYLAVQAADDVALVEVAEGTQLGAIKLKNAFPAGLAFSPDGKRLMVGHHENVKVYDLRDWTVASEMALRSDPPHAYEPSAWTDNRHVLLAGGLLVRPEDHLVLWDYKFIDRSRECEIRSLEDVAPTRPGR